MGSKGLPPDLEFSLEEICAELEKLGVREKSPTRLAAIKADLDRLIARDLETLEVPFQNVAGDEDNTASASWVQEETLSSNDGDADYEDEEEETSEASVSTLTSAQETRPSSTTIPLASEKIVEQESISTLGCSITSTSTDAGDAESEAAGSQSSSVSSGMRRKMWKLAPVEGNQGRPLQQQQQQQQPFIPSSRWSDCGQSDVSRMSRRTYSVRAPLRSIPVENLDRETPNFSRKPSTAQSSRPCSARRAPAPLDRSDPVSLWRHYSSQWERQARLSATNERALRWTVKSAMAIREVPVLTTSRRANLLNYGPLSLR